MNSKIESRTSQIDTEKCVRHADNARYDLVLCAAQRMREMKKQGRGATSIDALLEVQQGLLNTRDYLLKVK